MQRLLNDIKDILLDGLRVVYIEGDQPIVDENGNIAFNYLWQLIGKASIVEFLQYRKEDGKEQFAPLTILRTINVHTSEGAYVAPVTLTMAKGHSNVSLDWWAWFRVNVTISWESLR
jgi:hypothetical protein